MPGVLEKFLYGNRFCDEIMPPSCICIVPTQPPTYTEKTGSSMQGYLVVPMRSLLRRQRTTSKIRSIDVRILRRLMHFRDSQIMKYFMLLDTHASTYIYPLLFREESLENRVNKVIVLARPPNLFTRNLVSLYQYRCHTRGPVFLCSLAFVDSKSRK